MTEKVVLDSSAIAAVFFREARSADVERVLEKAVELHTVDLAAAEVLNVAWKRIHLFKEDRGVISEALRAVIKFIGEVCVVHDSVDLATDALELALTIGVAGYDALFLALASREGAQLLTLDENLAAKVLASPHDHLILRNGKTRGG
ncbi:MAG: type II toxin-antitoxin system VapC family toxin [Promethearchaeota archaeon]